MSDNTLVPKAEIKLADVLGRLETKWQAYWETHQIYRAANPGDAGAEKPKYYVLDMFPYPSGEGLHVGHPLGYIATDIVSRYKRMRGFNVLHPMGWDAFGLPAEQYAIQKGIHPAVTTEKNIQTYKRQLRSLGLGYDWSREFSTTQPSYYKWTQWIFERLYERGLAYQADIAVNWCPALGTVLANDEVIDGKSERGGHPVVRQPMRQWVLKITEYADRLLQDLDDLDWPESTKDHQRNWIGKSVGARVRFALESHSDKIEVFTTRPDTLFGVTFLVLAPEHALVASITTPDAREKVQAYCAEAARKTDLQRTDLAKGKSGVFTGAYATHPLTGARVPVWVADYVLATYGTGAVMGVPAHDERDQEFAQQMNLPIVPVINEQDIMINSPGFDGLPANEALEKIVEALAQKGAGEKTTTFKLRDWLFARQRYWGEPIPVIHVVDGPDAGQLRLLANDELPLELPPVERYEPTGTGESPLAAVTAWVAAKDPVTHANAKRETNTMPGSAGSSWYFLRYMDPRNDREAFSQNAVNYWQQVDLYVGGSEHAVGHLLYARFWHKVLYDLKLVPTREPFKKLVHQGLMLGEDNEKMSKSRGNVVNPDHIIAQYGADTLRLFEMFMGPLEKSKPWQTNSIEGVYRFLSRFWRLVAVESDDPAAATAGAAAAQLNPRVRDVPPSEWPAELTKSYHRTVKQVTEDIEALRFNTALSAQMILLNDCYAAFKDVGIAIPKDLVQGMTLMLAPFAPHLGEELWEMLGHPPSVTQAAWPTYDESKIVSDEIELAIQINGKLRDTLRVSKGITEAELRPQVMALESVRKWLDGKEPKKFIFVKGKLVSLVV